MKRIFKYSLYLLLAVLPFIKYNGNELNSVYQNYQFYNVDIFFQSWFGENLGSGNFFFIPFDMLVRVLYVFFDPGTVLLLSYILPVFIAFLSIDTLLSFLFKNNAISCIGSFFYVYSIYGQFMSGWGIHSGMIVHALAPYFAFLFLSVKSNTSVVFQTAKFGLLTFLLLGINLTFILYLVLLCGLCLVLNYFVLERAEFFKSMRLFLLMLVVLCFTNSAFLLSFGSGFVYKSSYVNQSLLVETPEWKSSTSYVRELLRQMGAVNFYYSHKDSTSYPNAQPFIKNTALILLSYSLPALVLASFIFSEENYYFKKLRVFLLAGFVASFFMLIGVQVASPTRFLYYFLYTHIPYFSIFRDAYKAMFYVNLFYSIMLSYFLYKLKLISIKKYIGGCLVVPIIVAVLSSSYWTGTFFNGEKVRIPTAWYKFSTDYYTQYPDAKLVLVPNLPFPAYHYTKKQLGHTNFFRPLMNQNNFSPTNVPSSYIEFKNAFFSYEEKNYPALLGFYSLEKVLLQYDVNWELYNKENPYYVQRKLAEIKQITKEKTYYEN